MNIDLDKLKEDILKLQELSYRRGLQQGVVLANNGTLTESDVSDFRFNYPLEHLNPLNPKKGVNYFGADLEDRLKMEIGGHNLPNLKKLFDIPY